MVVKFNKATMLRMLEFLEQGGELRPEGQDWTPDELMALAAACFQRVMHPTAYSRPTVAKVLKTSAWDGTPAVLLPYKDCRELHGAVDWLMYLMRRQASGTFDRDFEAEVAASVDAMAHGVLTEDRPWPEVRVLKGSRKGDRRRAECYAEAHGLEPPASERSDARSSRLFWAVAEFPFARATLEENDAALEKLAGRPDKRRANFEEGLCERIFVRPVQKQAQELAWRIKDAFPLWGVWSQVAEEEFDDDTTDEPEVDESGGQGGPIQPPPGSPDGAA